MQVFRTTANDNEFLRRYGKYYTLITLGIFLAQILSGFTESGLLFSSVKDATIVFGDSTANVLGVLGAIIGVSLIEIVGLRVALTGAVDAFLYRRFKGLDLLFSIALIVLTVVLVPSSFILSIQGGDQIIENLKEQKEQQETTEIKKQQSAAVAQLDTVYARNILDLNSTYTSLINSQLARSESDKVVKEQNFKHWRSKGKRYKTKINSALVALQQVEAEKTNKIAELKEKKAEEKKALKNRYDREKDEILSQTKNATTETTEKIQTKSAAFKTGTKYIVLIAMFFAVGFTVMHRIYLKGSGIEELAEPNNFFFAPTLFSEKIKLAQDRKQINRRNKIAAKRAQLPQLTPYVSTLPIHDVAAMKRTILELQMQQGDQRQVYYLDSSKDELQTVTNNDDLKGRIESLVQSQIELEGAKHHEAAKIIELQAKEVIKLYLTRNNQSTTDTEILRFQSAVIEHLNSPNESKNPFDENRKKIGFKQQNNGIENGTIHSPLYGDRMVSKSDAKICANNGCNNSLQGKHWNQKYCSDECRIAAWENRTGRNLKKKSKK